jgi:hypothetical protein
MKYVVDILYYTMSCDSWEIGIENCNCYDVIKSSWAHIKRSESESESESDHSLSVL